MEKVYAFLQKAKIYYLATVEEDQPRVRPFGSVHIFENKIYVQTGKIKDVSKQLSINPKAEICAYRHGKWLRIATTLVNDDRIIAKQSMLDANPMIKKMYKADDDNTQVLYLENSTATFSSFGKEPEVYNF